ncbi:hypothetical protein [Nocardia terpenica]|uniref:Uncharacterized protein n=1 Tax=Nocardia terpenica TaxID=455432 RepID=A0A164LBU5_9NOCA|nr:hypothetical protein [Nocardia terpenica]KZM72235.1 hypothetical protein AWN90_36790 [Nocardia terpenica]NQE86620.1 hypothetical protein [Nocardia terpenica]
MVSLYKWTPQQYERAEQFFDVFDGVFRPSAGRAVPSGVEVVTVDRDYTVTAAQISPDGVARYFRDGVQIPHVDPVLPSAMTRTAERYAAVLPEVHHAVFEQVYGLTPARAAEALLVHASGMPLCLETWLYAARIDARLRAALAGAEHIVRLPMFVV